MKKYLAILIPVSLLLVSGLIYLLMSRDTHNGDTIRVSGNIEVTESRLGFRIPGTLEQRLVSEGDTVFEGQLLAVLESSEQKAALARALANVDYSRSVLDELTAGTRPQDLDRARAELERARAASASTRVQLAQARSDFERFEALYKSDSISQREYEQYKTRFETAKNQNLEAAARETNARQALSLSEEGPRLETLDQARARLAEARAAHTQADIRLNDTRLTSPINGVVLTQAAEAGEYLNPGSAVLVVGNLARPWVRAYIHETDLGRVRLNDTAQVTTDGFLDKTFTGTVSFISSQAEFTPKAVQTFEERVKLMFRIKIDLENPDGYLKPGMPADALIASPAWPGND